MQPIIRVSAFHVLQMNLSPSATTTDTLIKVSANTNTKSVKTKKSLESSIMEAVNVSAAIAI